MSGTGLGMKTSKEIGGSSNVVATSTLQFTSFL